MITRHHDTLLSKSTAIYSDCEKYRYALTRIWDEGAKRVLFVMLNPSTANEVQNDPTVERCERRARALGFGAFRVTNIFAWRDTDPRKMRAASEPIGPENDATILEGAGWADSIVAAWGTHGAYLDRGPHVAALLSYGSNGLPPDNVTEAGCVLPRNQCWLIYLRDHILMLNMTVTQNKQALVCDAVGSVLRPVLILATVG